jgi:hypothetical protein
MLEERPAGTRDADIVVEQSETGGLGVFVREGARLQPGDVVTEFPGPAEWVTEEELMVIEKGDTTYAFTFGPFHIRGRAHYIMWNPVHLARVDLASGRCKAHLLNTAHPLLDGAWGRCNCVYGLYTADLQLDTELPPDVQLYAVCVRSVDGWGHRELLFDYHWHLAEFFCLPCLDEYCTQCKLCLQTYMSRWKRGTFKELSRKTMLKSTGRS